MNELEKLIQSLHPLERKVLPFLENSIKINTIIQKTNLQEVEVLRALQWLENKKLLIINKDAREIIKLDKNGERYLKIGLPERRFLNVLRDGNFSLQEVKNKANLDDNEAGISLGILKKKNAINLGHKISLTSEGKKLLKTEFIEEQLLKKLPVDIKKLHDEEVSAYHALKNRKEIVKADIEKDISIILTELGIKLKNAKLGSNLVEALTHEMLTKGEWKGKTFRRYDLKSIVPKYYPGKRHFVNESISYIKRIWLDLGFKEMTGNLVQTGFWNFDALFTPQDHPARDLQDTFYIKDPSNGNLTEKKIVNNVKLAHEKGISGSRGWRYSWKEDEARRNVLRTHTTVLSAKTIASLKKEDLPAKFFSVGKVFRNETVDWKHAFEFYQVEGIVVDENANFRNLLGYLKEYYKKLGFDKVRFRPDYFPYTEMSCVSEVYHPIKKQWVEVGGAGIFRPEVVIPLLGKDIPVLAWGQGMERSIMEYYNIHDLRDIYGNDLKKIREIKLWIK